MYSGAGFSDWEIGDITVIKHNGTYHLFHLIIPNHDYIAHAVSTDGISWSRVKNALFVGDPGEWDDDMLWTMHVCHVDDRFEMYYTGLHRKDRGGISKIGLAISDDMLNWKKSEKSIFPIEPKGVYYEAFNSNPRTWLSFRDPFRFQYDGEVYLLICSRSTTGPVSRRGCVGLVKITDDLVERLPPLLYPMVYDDIECPCIFYLRNRFYLIGSIREDIKVRYWSASSFLGEYYSFEPDVFLPQGNYAARIVEDEGHILVYNFFYAGKIDTLRVLPPPKEIDADEKGRLFLKTYYRWEMMVEKTVLQKEIQEIQGLLSNPTASSHFDPDEWTLGTRVGYEIFYFEKPSNSFIWEGRLTAEGLGKFGLVSDMDKDGNGYFISFDLIHGLSKIRSWGFNPRNPRQNYIFSELQFGYFHINSDNSFNFRLIRYGHYIEMSVNEVVVLTLMDYTFMGNGLGLYTSSSIVKLHGSIIKSLPDPVDEYGGQKQVEENPPV
jgi:beta-fructofuranosidase